MSAFRCWRRSYRHSEVQAALDGVREISLFTRDPKREHTLKIVSALREQTGCKIQLFSYEDEDVLRRELADSQDA